MVYVFLADGFEEIEALTPVDVLKRAGVEVTTVALGENGFAVGSHNIAVKADTTINKAVFDDLEMIILPGGMPGTTNLDGNEKLHSILDMAYSNGKYVAAICAAPMIIGKKGYLSGKKATCFPGFEKHLLGADYTANGVEVDGKVITAKGMGKAMDFALALVGVLKGKQEADIISASFFA